MSPIAISKAALVALLVGFVFLACTTPAVVTVRTDEPERGDAQGGRESLPDTITANNETIRLDPGRYRGTLTIKGNRVTVTGAGSGSTEIAGDIRISGNSAKVTNLTVSGSVLITGNNADLTGARIHGSVDSRGNNNSW